LIVVVVDDCIVDTKGQLNHEYQPTSILLKSEWRNREPNSRKASKMADADRFETHLTLAAESVATPSDSDRSQIKEWATARNMKWTHIVLSSGQNASQPMISWQRSGTLETQKLRAHELWTELTQLNQHVVRVKIEAHIDNACVPSQAPHEMMLQSDDQYFEHHVKLCLHQQSDMECLQQIAAHHDARISANARRVRLDGHAERFLTQRVFKAGRERAMELLKGLLIDLKNNSFEILEVESEFVVFDSNLTLDDGWK